MFRTLLKLAIHRSAVGCQLGLDQSDGTPHEEVVAKVSPLVPVWTSLVPVWFLFGTLMRTADDQINSYLDLTCPAPILSECT